MTMALNFILLVHLVIGLFAICRKSEALAPKTHMQYTYRFVKPNALSPKEFPNKFDKIRRNKFKIVETVQRYYTISKQQKSVANKVQNFYKILKGFEKHHCLLVIDNWQGVDIQQMTEIPSLNRQLELAFSHRKISSEGELSEYLDTVLLPTKSSLKQVNFSNYHFSTDEYHNCPISKFYFPLILNNLNEAFCVDLIHETFLLNSKPWQCEIQVSLLMPEHLFRNNHFPGYFRYNYCKNGDCNKSYGFNFLPSTQPKVHILLSFKNVQNLDSVNLMNWITNLRKFASGRHHYGTYKIGYRAQNNVNFVGQVVCSLKVGQLIDYLTCNILTVSYINLCVECPNSLYSTVLNDNLLSFNKLELVERIQMKRFWYGGSRCPETYNRFNLCGLIQYFFEEENQKTLSLPLKNFPKITKKYSDKIEVLGFVLTSVLKHLLGNVTEDIKYTSEKFLKTSQFELKQARFIVLQESIFEDQNVALSFENKFGSLRFVSCGSRGFEGMQVGQFVSVFEKPVWIWILTVNTLLLLAMHLIKGSICLLHVLDRATCLAKVLLEQGDPFPGRYCKSKTFRFVICGTLLAGLVLSNAFKSSNVYNIVLPKHSLSFHTIDELVKHDFKVYSKIREANYFLYGFRHMPWSSGAHISVGIYAYKYLLVYSQDDQIIFSGISDIDHIYGLIQISPKKLKVNELDLISYLSNYTAPQLRLHDIIMEPLHTLRPLIQIGLVKLQNIYGGADTFNFWEKQKNFIVDDLKKCNKTAWLLPDYQAQQLTRMLYRSGKHSDVGIVTYFKPKLDFYFTGVMPPSLIRRASMISSSGLLEWWSNLINRTDLVRRREVEPPKRPNMFGNIQILFLLLPVGMFFAFISIILELHGYVFKILKSLYRFCLSLILQILEIFTTIWYSCMRKILLF